MRWLVAILCWLPCAASAQADLGTLTIALPTPLRSHDFLVYARPAIPRALDTQVPAPAIDALEAYYTAIDATVHAIAELRALPSGPDRSDTSAQTLARGLVQRHALEEAAAREDLAAALEHFEATLSAPALLLLGALRFDASAERYSVRLEALDACLGTARTDCGEPVMEDERAIATWSRVVGADVTAAWALYERGHSLSDHGDVDGAVALLRQAQAITGLPAPLEAIVTFLLGELLAPTAPHDALAAYARCATQSDSLAAHCALRAAALLVDRDREADALTSLAPWLDDDGVRDEARRFAGELVARRGALPPLATLSPTLRARVWTAGAAQLAEHGLVTRALAAIARARAIAPSAQLDALQTRIAAQRTTDAVEPWLRRAVLFCARGLDEVPPGRFEIRGELTPRGPRAIVTRRARPALARCLAHAPAPETPLSGAFRAEILLTPP